MYRCRKCHQRWNDNETLRNQFRCFADCGGDLEPEPAAAGEVDQLTLESILALPSFLAIPLTKFYVEDRPMIRLQRLGDAVEVLVRFFTILGIAELRHALADRPLPEKVLSAFQFRIERPTLGQWRDMLVAISGEMPTSPPVSPPETWQFVRQHLLPALLETPEELGGRNLLALRNFVIHSGVDAPIWAAGELEACDPWVQALWPRLEFLKSLELCSMRAGVARRLTTGEIEAAPVVELPKSFHGDLASFDRHVVLVTKEALLDLWPICEFGRGSSTSPAGRKESAQESPLIYLRCDRDRLLYAALGGDLPFAERFDERAAFLRLFRLESRTSPESTAPSDFESEIRRDAAALVGRIDVVKQIKAAIKETQQGLLWIGGPGGSGKSFVMAKVADDLLGAKPQQLCRIAWRFKKSDQTHCNRLALFRHAVASLARWPPLAQPELLPATDPNALLEQLVKLLDGAAQLKPIAPVPSAPRVVFLLDGLDEIAWSDPEFPALLLGLQRDNVVWVCSGREDRPLFPEQQLRRIFAPSLPPMSAADIRGMLLDGTGRLKYDLLDLDKETKVPGDPTKSQVTNVAIAAIVARAAGSPLFVRHVIDDITSGHFTFEDLPRRLPPSLEVYFRDLLHRLSIGQMQMLLTPLLVAICQAKAPINAETLHWLMYQRQLLLFDEAGLAHVCSGLDRMRSQVQAVTLEGGRGVGYEPHHARFLEFVLEEPDLKQQHQITCDRFCAAVGLWKQVPADNPAREYLFRFGVQHLVAGQQWATLAEVLTDFDFVQGALEAGAIYDLVEGYRALPGHLQTPRLQAWRGFINRETHVLAGHPQLLLQQALNQPDESLLAQEAQERLSRPGTRQPLLRRLDKDNQLEAPFLTRTYSGHGAAVTTVSLTADGRVLSGSSDGVLKFWELATGRELAEFTGGPGKVLAIVARPDRWLVVYEAYANDEWSAYLKRVERYEVWNVKFDTAEHSAGEQIATMAANRYQPALAVSPDGRTVVSVAQANEELVIWELETGKEVGRFRGHTASVYHIAFLNAQQVVSADNSLYAPRLARQDAKGNVKAWDLPSGELKSEWDAGQGSRICALAAEDQRLFVAASDSSVLPQVSLRAVDLLGREAPLVLAKNLVWEPNKVWLTPQEVIVGLTDYVGNDANLRVLERTSGKLICELRGHAGMINSIALTADGKQLVSGSSDGSAKIWDYAAALQQEPLSWQQKMPQAMKSIFSELGQEFTGRLQIPQADALTADGFIAVRRQVDSSKDAVRLYELEANREVSWRAVTDGSDRYSLVRALAISPGTRLWATGDHMGCIRVFKLSLANQLRTNLPTAIGQYLADNSTLLLTITPHEKHDISHLALARNCLRGVSASVLDNDLQVWELESGVLAQGLLHKQAQTWNMSSALPSSLFWRVSAQRALSGHRSGITALALTSDDQHAITASSDKTIKVWNLADGRELHTLTGHAAVVRALALSPDHSQIISGGEDSSICMGNVDGRLQEKLGEHRQAICALLVTPDGKHLLSSGKDRWLKVWDLASRKLVAEFHTRDVVTQIGLSPGGQIILRDGSGQLHVLALLGANGS